MSVRYGTQARTILLITVMAGNYHVGLSELSKVGRGHRETFTAEWQKTAAHGKANAAALHCRSGPR